MIVLLPGESFSWGAGSVYDGTVLAAYGQVLVVTLNARLGVLGMSLSCPVPFNKLYPFQSCQPNVIYDISECITLPCPFQSDIPY